MDSIFSHIVNSFTNNLLADQRYQMILEGMDRSPLNDAARESLRPQVNELIEETTSRGFRVKLILGTSSESK